MGRMRQNAAEALQIVQADVLRRPGGVKGDDLTDLSAHPAVQIAAQQLSAEECVGGRYGKGDFRVIPGQLLGKNHPEQGLYIGDAREDGTHGGILGQVHQKLALFKGRGHKVQLCQSGKQFAHQSPRPADALLFKLGVIIGAQPLTLAGRQPQMVDQGVQGVVGQYPLSCQGLGEGSPLHARQPGQSGNGHFFGLQQVPQVFAEQQQARHLLV